MASKEIGRTEIGVELAEKSRDADTVVLRPTVNAPTSGDGTENSRAAITGRLKWSCILNGTTEIPLPPLCSDQTASADSDTPFPRLTQSYTVTAVTSKKIGTSDQPISSNPRPVPPKIHQFPVSLCLKLHNRPTHQSRQSASEAPPNK